MLGPRSDNDDRELAIKLAGDCLSEVPALVLGSGASCAHGIGGMRQLAEFLCRHVVPHHDDLEVWNQFSDELRKTADLELALQEVSVSDRLLDQIVARTRQLIVSDEQAIYSQLITGNLDLPLSSLFRHLFQTTHRVLNVVTTNYDRLVEFAVCQAGFRYNTGFSDGPLRHFHCQKSEPTHYQRIANFRCVDVWKVHGSVDWFERSDSRVVGVLDEVPALSSLRPLIVSPGRSKYSRTHQEPFRSVITFSDQALSSARAFLCIGYGFSDEHIEPKLIQRSSDMRVPIIILAKELRPNAKRFLDRHLHSKVVAFEEDAKGTRAYTSARKEGIVFEGEEIWSLEGLLRKLRVIE